MIKAYPPILLFSLLLVSFATQAVLMPPAPKLSAKGYLLVDMYSGRILAEKNADQRLEPASLTKIMTAYVVFQQLQQGFLQLSDQVTVSKKAWKMPGSRMFIEVGSQVTLEDLLRGLVIQSGNDAAVALAEHIAGDEAAFANMMNTQAARLGMHNTHFVNAEGMPDPEHYTTPRDILQVTQATIRDFPEYYTLYAEKAFTYNDIRQENRNSLLWRDESVDGVKTGHTQAAGYCLVASAQRDTMRLISVVMGTQSKKTRTRESQSLLDYGFRFYATHLLRPGSKPLLTTRVWQGEQEQLALGLAQDWYLTIPRGQHPALKIQTTVTAGSTAPIIQGQTLGSIQAELDGQEISRVPLIALTEMPEGNFWRKLTDSVLQLLE